MFCAVASGTDPKIIRPSAVISCGYLSTRRSPTLSARMLLRGDKRRIPDSVLKFRQGGAPQTRYDALVRTSLPSLSPPPLHRQDNDIRPDEKVLMSGTPTHEISYLDDLDDLPLAYERHLTEVKD